MRPLAFKASLLALAGVLAFAATSAFAQVADLLVTKTGPVTSLANTDVAFVITVLNAGPDDATNVTLNDVIPAGMTFVSLSQDSGAVFGCSAPAVGAGGTITCTIATFSAGSSAEFTATFHIPPGTPDGVFFTNIATVTSDFDPNEENNSSTAVTSTPSALTADLGVTKSSAEIAGPDTDVIYTIVMQNGGPDDAASATLTDPLPGSMTFVSVVQESGPAMSCITPAVGSGGIVTCSAATFPAGATATFTLIGHIPTGTSGEFFTNIATVASSTFDPNVENDSSAAGLLVSSVDTSLTKTGPATASANAGVSYVLTVSNAGPDIAQNLVVTDVLPAPTTFVSLIQDNGPTAICTTPTVGANGTVTCAFSALNPGSSAQFTLTINSGSAVAIVNSASVASDNFDPDQANNSSSATTAVAQSADIGVTKTGPAAVNAGSLATYTLTLTNAGPSNATSVTLTDVMPATMTFVSVVQNSGPPATCTTPAIGGTGTVTCALTALSVGASAQFTLTLDTSIGASIVNSVSGAATAIDPNPSNNTASASTSVNASVGASEVPIPALNSFSLALLALGILVTALSAGRRRRDF